jgi:RNA polymerase sigma-70 factor (ECF subfamily)
MLNGSLNETAGITRAPAASALSGGFRLARLDESPASLRQTKLAVIKAKEGDRDALQYLYERYSNNVYSYVRSIVRDEHDSEDLTQHVFTKLTTAVAKYDDRGIPFTGWLLRMARNVAIDHLRSRRTTPVEEVLDPEAASSSDIDAPIALREALESLAADQREVFLLRHVVGLSPTEIATRMGRSEASIHGLHHRGRRALQSHLSQAGWGPSIMRRSPLPRRQLSEA